MEFGKTTWKFIAEIIYFIAKVVWHSLASLAGKGGKNGNK
jgi:hypothetical protein